MVKLVVLKKITLVTMIVMMLVIIHLLLMTMLRIVMMVTLLSDGLTVLTFNSCTNCPDIMKTAHRIPTQFAWAWMRIQVPDLTSERSF